MTQNKFNLRPWMMLLLRSLLFFVFQGLIGLAVFSGGFSSLWEGAAAWWPITVILTDLICLGLLVSFYREEGERFWDIFRFDRQHLKQDLWTMLAFLVLLGPVGFLPNILSARWLFGDPQAAADLLIRPLPAWAAVLGLAFPFLQGLVEIPMYMLYVRPRLEKQGVQPWLAVALTGFFLSAQHVFIPFIPDPRFITYRLVMFQPFALLIAVVMRWRPRLMPYFGIVHVLMNLSVAVMFLLVMHI